jgi:hypothetical protein
MDLLLMSPLLTSLRQCLGSLLPNKSCKRKSGRVTQYLVPNTQYQVPVTYHHNSGLNNPNATARATSCWIL